MFGVRRRGLVFYSVAVSALAIPLFAQAEVRRFDIPGEDAATSIPQFARQAGLQILVSEPLTRGVRTGPVVGAMEPNAGLDLLLAGTGLRVASREGAVVTLSAAGGEARFHGEGDADEAGESADVEELIVTGTALQNRAAIDTRRSSLSVVDALAQDDTGDLADQSLAEALSRVPAVSTMQVLYGEQESQYVAVRGITPDLNYVSVDGIGMISVANQGAGQRRVDLALIPSQAAQKTEVFKTFTADQDAGAIGGIINIVPYSAFGGRDKFYIDAFVNYVTNDDVPGGNSLGDYRDSPWSGGVKGLWTHRFGADEQFGLVLSGTYQQRSYDDVKRNPNGRTYYTASGATTAPDEANWNGYDPAPQAMVDYEFTSFIKTYGGSATFEFQPSQAWYNSLLLYDYMQTEDQTNNVFTLRAFANIRNQTQHTGTLSIPDVRTGFNYDRFENESRGAIFRTRYEFDDATNLEFRAGYNENTFYDLEYANAYQYKPAGLSVDYDTSGESVDFSLAGAGDLMDPGKYALLTAGDTRTEAKATSFETRLDFSRNFDGSALGFGYKAGAGVRRMKVSRDLEATNYVTDKSSLAGYEYSPAGYVPWMWGYPVLWIDHAKYRDEVLPGLAVNEATSASDSFASDYRYAETISYAYVQGLYALDQTRFLAGLRLDKADYSANVPIAVGGVYQPGTQRHEGDYQNLLPSFSVIHDFSDKLRLKAGYSRTLGRPAPEDIAQAETRNDTSFTISRGNPDLKPRRSDNFDATLEYYFDEGGGLATIGAFYKTIKDDIYTLREEQLIDGITYTISTPMNASKSKMRGVEVQYINNAIPGMPGPLAGKVGVALNATRTWGDMDYVVGGNPLHVDRLLFQRNWMANAAVFMKLPRDGEARLGYNWGDAYYDGIGADPWLHRGPQARGQLDATLRYRVAEDWIVKLQAKNVLNEDLYLGYGEDLSMRRAEMKKGRSFFLNIIYRP